MSALTGRLRSLSRRDGDDAEQAAALIDAIDALAVAHAPDERHDPRWVEGWEDAMDVVRRLIHLEEGK